MSRPTVRRWAGRIAAGGLIGLAAAGAAIGAGELVAVVTGPETDPVAAVGAAVIDLTPTSLKEWAVQTFGTRDKPVLLAGIFTLLGLFAVTAGVLALRRLWVGVLVVVGFGVLGMSAASSRPVARISSLWPSLAAVVAGAIVLRLLTGLYRRGWPPEPGPAPARPPNAAARRDFVIAALGSAAAAALAGFGGRALLAGRYDVTEARAAVRIPVPARPAAPVPPAAHPAVPGLSPFFTRNSAFYRVDTDLVLPQVDPRHWKLRIHGMVGRPVELTFEDLLRRPLDEHDMTLSCVSNQVGGPLVGNARWIGAPLAGLLREAGVRTGATQLLSRSTDGFTVGTPIEAVLDGRASLLAVAMNGEALPIAHGFPCRMLVPGFFGYASATKWLVDLELTTYEAATPYWVDRGWDRLGVMKTASRIDVPRSSARLAAGPVTVAGVAWATHRGIAAVEVRIDGGAWAAARLADADGIDAWRQWSYDWTATRGTHHLEVRATDGTGTVQTGTRVPPFPSGSTGWHRVTVSVT